MVDYMLESQDGSSIQGNANSNLIVLMEKKKWDKTWIKHISQTNGMASARHER